LFYPALEILVGLGCEIMEIFTCEVDNKTEFNKQISGFAKKNNIPCRMTKITHADIKRLIDNGCDWAICGGYYFKIPSDTALPIVNIHPSLLPTGRGSWPMAQAILWGHKKSGVTIHKIAEGFDTGDIILQKEFSLANDETHQSFMKKANGLLNGMLKNLVENFDELYRNAKKQGDGEYWKAPTEADFTVTENMTADKADIILRAFFGYECIYKGEGKKQVIIGGRAVKSDKADDTSLPLADGYIKIEKI
jgi:methionyl-tRNA formyltransferase